MIEDLDQAIVEDDFEAVADIARTLRRKNWLLSASWKNAENELAAERELRKHYQKACEEMARLPNERDSLSTRIAELEAERDRYRDALIEYAKPANWGRPFICGTEQLSDYRTVFMVDGHGCDLAKEALAPQIRRTNDGNY